MTSNWYAKKLSEVCKVIAGQSPEGRFYNKVGNGLPFYQGKKEFKEKFIGEPTIWTTNITKEALFGDVLMSVRAPVGPVNFATEKICIGRGLAAIRSGKELDKDFLFYFLQMFENEIIGNEGAVFNSISKTQIENIKIPLPPIPEQERIVQILDEIFKGVDKAKENAEKNLQNARELFESYLQNVFINSDNGWEEKRLEEILQKTETIDPTKNPNEEFIYIDVSSVNNKSFTIENITLLKGINAPSRARKLIKNGDVIFATVRPTLKRIAVVPKEYDGQICSTGYFVIRGKEQVNNKLLFYFLLTNSFNESMKKLQKGASYPAVTDKEVKEQVISFPRSLSEQQIIVSKLDSLTEETKKLGNIYKQKLTNLEELKKSILKKAFNGEL